MKCCSRCGEMQDLENFYFVSRKLGTRRGECKACMSEMKAAQKDPEWRPKCTQCGVERDRRGPGRRLCDECFAAKYDSEDRRANGSHRQRLKDCPACGVKRLRADHTPGTSLCPVCRGFSQSRRKRLRLYNLTPRDFLALMEVQGYRCAACHGRPRSPFHVDHQHSHPMIVRGLICARCNTILGLAKDRRDVLYGAVAYLEAPPAQSLLPGHVASVDANRSYNPLTRVTVRTLERGNRPANWPASELDEVA